jgi:hypothetical protein
MAVSESDCVKRELIHAQKMSFGYENLGTENTSKIHPKKMNLNISFMEPEKISQNTPK